MYQLFCGVSEYLIEVTRKYLLFEPFRNQLAWCGTRSTKLIGKAISSSTLPLSYSIPILYSRD